MTEENFPKKYNAEIEEKEILNFWDEHKVFSFDKNSKKPIFSIDTPPPTMSGSMHAGHAFSYAQCDFVARYKRMNGFEVYYPFGTDDNGLATEKLVEKAKKVNLKKQTRKDAVKIVLEYLNETRPQFIQDWKNLGISCDFDKLKYSTIDTYSQKISQNSFIELYNKGLIERRKGPVMWDRKFQTGIAQADLEDKERKAFLNYVKAKIVGSENTYMIYATTRPELCFGVVGMSIEDTGKYVKLEVKNNGKTEYWITGKETVEEKFKNIEHNIIEELIGEDIIGEKVTIPVVNKDVEISHDIAVKADFGTGIAYFCTYGGQEDIDWVARHNTKPIEVLNVYGKLTQLGGKYEGQLAENARKEIIKDMEEEGSLIFKEEKTQVVSIYERSGIEIEFIVTNQWYGKYLDKKEAFFENIQKFNWTPNFMKVRVENWIKGLKWDWGFSRQRHFGIPIPVWYCSQCKKQYLANTKDLPVDPTKDKAPVKKCDCGNSEFIGETDVCDTWFTSATSPILASKILGEKTFDKVFPMTLRPQGHDIINTWLFYTMAKTNMHYEMNPFSDVNISGFVLAPDGTKMSKSKGNGVNPQDVVKKFSNDALRFAAGATKLGADQPYQEKEVKTGFATANKIFNATKFTDMLLKNFTKEDKKINLDNINSIDKWILSKMQKTITSATTAFEEYDYAKAKTEFEGFFMRDIADNYIEIVKERLWKPEVYGEKESKKAQTTLYNVMYSAIKGLAPIMPFITEKVYQGFFSKFEKETSIHQTTWPLSEERFGTKEMKEIEKSGDNFISIVSAVRKYKSEKQVSMKTEIQKLSIECNKETQTFIENSIADLKSVTGSIEIVFEKSTMETSSKDVKISISMKVE